MSNMQPAWPTSVDSDVFRMLSCSWVGMKGKFYSNVVNYASTMKFCKQYLCCNVLYTYCIITFYSGKFPTFNSGRCEKSYVMLQHSASRIKFISDQKMHFVCLDVILFHSDNRYVSGTNVAIFVYFIFLKPMCIGYIHHFLYLDFIILIS
jgi:hypothetical protein